MAEVKPEIETFAKIKVVGVGGSGGSSANRMIASKIRGVDFIAMNTDVQALHLSLAPTKLHIGKTVTRGLGAGMDPEVGARAAEESAAEIREALKGADMVFVSCGLGGGTGSGASPVVAAIAKELGALTVAVVTRPFAFEGTQRKAIAEGALEKLASQVDTIITIPNDRILQLIDRKTTMMEAFETIDDVLRQAVQGISELITSPGQINTDFADVRKIMNNKGAALMGIGRGHGENRATDAAKAAIASPLLEVSMDGAKSVLISITGGSNLTLQEVHEAATLVTKNADQDATVIWGTSIDESMKDDIKVTVIATGFDRVPPGMPTGRARVQAAPAPAAPYVPKSPAPEPRPASNSNEPLARVPMQQPRVPNNPVPPGFGVPSASQPQPEPIKEPAPSVRQSESNDVVEELPKATGLFSRVISKPEAPAPKAQPIEPRTASSSIPPVSRKSEDEDDMDAIPSFIRKKMM
ncbi:cell division protein FtsZ [Candidatus Uhrbacteria bacterium]|nr:cell division protein FtsZ [Candidatus Uhrbacteria bacterium]